MNSRAAIFCLLPLLLCGMKSSLNADEFTPPQLRVGAADYNGRLNIAGHFGSLDFDDALYPAYFLYSSDPSYDNVHFGRGFKVPLLEARLVDHDYYLESTTLGGQVIYLYRKPNDPEQYASQNGFWTAEKKGKNSFIRTSPDGFTLNFTDGRLRQIRSPGGKRFDLAYTNGVCHGIRGKFHVEDGAKFANAEGLTQGVLQVESQRYRLYFAPFATDGEFDLERGGSTESLAAIDWGNGTKSMYLRTPGATGGSELTMWYGDQRSHYVWDATGQLRAVNGDLYDIDVSQVGKGKQANPSVGDQNIRIRRRHPDGTVSLYSKDEVRGIITEQDRSGPIKETHLIRATGSAFGKIRTIKIDGERTYMAHYDSTGRLIREQESTGDTYHVHPGTPFDPAILSKGDYVVRYDDEGRLVRKTGSDYDAVIQYLRDGYQREITRFPDGREQRLLIDPYGKITEEKKQ